MKDKLRWPNPSLLKYGLLFLILGFIGITLFPYGVLAEQSELVWFVIYRIFASELSHFVGHFLIFCLIGTAILLLFPKLFRFPIFYLSLMLNMAILQELLQLATFKRRPINLGELKDLSVDIAGAVFIFYLLYFLYYRRQPGAER